MSFMDKLKKGMDVKTVSSIDEPEVAEEDSEEAKEEMETEEPETEEETTEEAENEPEEEAESNEEQDNQIGLREVSVEEMEERLKGNGDGRTPQGASVKNLISKMVSEDEPRKKGRKKPVAKKPIQKEKSFHINPVAERSHKASSDSKKEWFASEGELVCDVYELDGYVVIKSAIAGVDPDDLDISIENDTVSIRGSRRETHEEKGRNYFHQECYWGSFSREIILPAEVDGGKTEASMKNGILTIKVPKIEHQKKKISIK